LSPGAGTFELALSLLQAGDVEPAERHLRKLLKKQPQHPGALNVLALLLAQSGKYAEAEKYFLAAIKAFPSSDATYYNYAIALKALNRPAEALEMFNRSLAINPSSPDTWNNRGTVRSYMGDPQSAMADFDKAISLNPNHFGAHANKAKALGALQRYADACAAYDRAIALRPDFAEAWLGRGQALQALDRHDDALAAYDRAIASSPHLADAKIARGNLLLARARASEALECFEQALAAEPRNADAWVAKGYALLRLERIADALASYERALSLQPDLPAALAGGAGALLQLGRTDEAIAACDRGLAQEPSNAALLARRAAALARKGRLADAIRDYEEALRSGDDDPAAISGFVIALLDACDWDRLEQPLQRLHDLIGAGKAISLLVRASDDPAADLKSARSYVRAMAPSSFERRDHARIPADKVHIAYLSADFRNHPVAHQIAGLVEQHDRTRFDVTAISFGPDDRSAIRARLVAAFDRFEDMASVSDQEIAQRLRDLGVHIAVDLMGHTVGARTRVLASRPAPISVNYLGYPGTMGADFIDYVIADPIVLPLDQQGYYMEKIVHLPDCFFVHDPSKAISQAPPSRAQAGLPEQGFVFCSFNNAYKISAPVFEIWMRLLANVGGSVLWLPQLNDLAVANLRSAASRRGIDPQRLVFATRLPSLADHLARQKLADLFLDTLPYNAHSTAHDALWAGLPVLTCAGRTYVGRGAASMLHSVGLPELVTADLTEYEAVAMRLAAQPPLLQSIRRKLDDMRQTAPLFDLDRYRRHIESAYLTMWERWQRGEKPAPFSVTPLVRAPH
jgi:predicted O-linked N-acetylglucosamine transferase (SPINDLY family)